MGESLYISGGNPLRGSVKISGAKNAALPVMVASMLSDQKICLENIPMLSDTQDMVLLLQALGVDASLEKGRAYIHATSLTETVAPVYYVRRIRASMLILGALLAREGRVEMVHPGGDAIGVRPLNWHIMALEVLGAKTTIEGDVIRCFAPGGLRGGKIIFPKKSVGATETALMASVLARGDSEIHNGAEEPEIIDLMLFLNKMGAKITYQKQGVFYIKGGAKLGVAQHRVITDRIEAGSYAMAVAATGGELTLENIKADFLTAPLEILRKIGVDVTSSNTEIHIASQGTGLISCDIKTGPFPGFPTDMQAQFMALMCLCEGVSHIQENIFENRFGHASQLNKMGAEISIEGNIARVMGQRTLCGTEVQATDIRACFSLIIAALAGKGETCINDTYHIDRGYEMLDEKLRACGAEIRRA